MKKIEIVNGYKKYIKGKNEIEILKNINVKFETGKIYIIMRGNIWRWNRVERHFAIIRRHSF